jgi:hypothetical protein
MTMNLMRKALSALGGILLAALLIAALAPKATRGIAAALVQVVGNVSVTNPLDGNGNTVPVLTKDADSPVRSPFDVEASCTFAIVDTSETCFVSNFLTVPGGQVAKIEYASLSCFTSGTPVNSADLTVAFEFGQGNPNSSISDHFMTIPSGALTPNTGFGQTMNFYVAGTTSRGQGNFVNAVISGDSTTSGRCFITVNGYMGPQ